MIVGLDVDEVAAQLHSAWLALHNEKFGTTYRLEDFTDWDMFSTPTLLPLLNRTLYSRVIPYPRAKAATDMIRLAGHTVVFVTACGPNNETADVKEAWLRRYSFFKTQRDGIKSGHMIPTNDKSNAPVDLLIDDHIKNVRAFKGKTILINRPHNSKERWHTRADSLLDALPLIKDFAA